MSPPERRAWFACLVLGVLAGVGWALAPERFAQAWLAGLAAFLLWPVGSLAMLFVHALTGGRWGEALRPGLLAGAAATPLLVPLALPLLPCLALLYPWARPEGAGLPNRFWLNPAGFALRGGVALAVWVGLAALVTRRAELRAAAPFALVALAVTLTFASIDLTMSLDPRFTSSAYGMIAGAAAVVLAVAVAVLVAMPADPAVRDQVGRLLLALCALWTYLDFMQVLIVWQSDLAGQVPWYLARTAGPWGLVMAAAALLHGVGPILALLLPRVRRSARGLGVVAAVLVGAEALRSWWTVLPPALPGPLAVCCMGFMAALGCGWTVRRARHA